MGSTVRTLNGEGELENVYGYDEFGNDLFEKEIECSLFGYTGFQRDMISNTYYAQAREYKPEIGRFLSKDQYRYSNKKRPLSINQYIYCEQDPMNIVDLTGHEVIIVSGGPSDKDKFSYQFVETAIKNVNDLITEGVPKDNITWMVVNAGYNADDIKNFGKTTENLGVNIEVVNDKSEMVTYINNKEGGDARANDLITNMSFYCHGQCPKYSGSNENQLSFAYSIADLGERTASDIDFTQSDIESLDGDAFYETQTFFFSCNAGTKDENGMSFAQEWSNKTGGQSLGVENGRTNYSAINMAASSALALPGGSTFALGEIWNYIWNTELWKEKRARSTDREGKRGYSELGSLNYPSLGTIGGDLDVANPSNFGLFDRGWKEYLPTCEKK